jgi:mersacidin/lichenicidin family type 2 lantibiotic
MDIHTQIRAWKDPKFRSRLSSEELAPNPAGNRLVELDENELRGVWGSQEPVITISSEGYVCSVSGECNGTGQSCWSV